MRHFFLWSVLLALASHGWSFGADAKTDKLITEKSGTTLNWKVYLPDGYDENRIWPALVLTVPANCAHVEQDAWPLFANAGYFVAIMDSFPNGIRADAFVDSIADVPTQLEQKYKVDTARVYTLGYSVHGAQAMEVACKKPELFAGAVSICHFYLGQPPKAQNGHAQSYLVVSGDKDPNYPMLSRKDIYKPYEKAGDDIEFKDVPGLAHFFRKSEVPYEIEWLNSHGIVKDYPAQLATAEDFEKRKQFQPAAEIYKKLAETKRAHPAVAAALEKIKGIQQAVATAEAQKKQEREDAAASALQKARELREQKKWAPAQDAYRKLSEFAGTEAANTAKTELAAMLADPAVQKSFADPAADRQCRSLLSMANNYIRSGMNDEARDALAKVIATSPDPALTAEAKKQLGALK